MEATEALLLLLENCSCNPIQSLSPRRGSAGRESLFGVVRAYAQLLSDISTGPLSTLKAHQILALLRATQRLAHTRPQPLQEMFRESELFTQVPLPVISFLIISYCLVCF